MSFFNRLYLFVCFYSKIITVKIVTLNFISYLFIVLIKVYINFFYVITDSKTP